MNFEELQKTWQSQSVPPQITIGTNLLLKEIRRNQQHFATTIFWRDVREVGVAFLLFLYFFHRGWRAGDWTDCLVGVACLGIAAFMVVDRAVQHRKRPVINDSLRECVESSLHQTCHQIWLLKNIFWWYLLPIVATLGISVCVSLWHTRHSGPAVIGWVLYAIFGGLVYWGVYRLNQWAVRKQLEPRRQELEALLASLE